MGLARVVITHAGVGSIMLALAAGKKPIVAPRLYRYGEHVDDHQTEIARAFAHAKKVTLLRPEDDLAKKIAEASIATSGDLKPSAQLVEFLNRRIGRVRHNVA